MTVIVHPTKLPINFLEPNPLQPRGKIQKEDLSELVLSVKTYGVLEPLVVAHTPAGYQIIAGERRWRAAQLAGLAEVPVVVKETTPKGMLEMAIIENVQRVDLSPVERAQAFAQLQRDFNFTNEQIAERVGKSTSYVSNSLYLLKLPDAIKDSLVSGVITEGHARAILGAGSEKAMISCFKRVVKENGSVRRAEELARKYRAMDESGVVTSADPQQRSSPELEQWEVALQRIFPARTKVKLTQSSRQTKVTIVINGNPDKARASIEKLLKLS